ncbi:MAG: hypothetical protein WC148_06150 [Bacilli bacterium]
MFDRIVYWLFYYSKVYNLMKPILVWAYLHFDGDQEKIYEFLGEKGKISKAVLEHDLKDVKLKDYVSGIDFGKEKYFHIKSKKVVVVPKEEFKQIKLMWKEEQKKKKLDAINK